LAAIAATSSSWARENANRLLDRVVLPSRQRRDLAVIEPGVSQNDVGLPGIGSITQTLFTVGHQHGEDAGERFFSFEAQRLYFRGGRHDSSVGRKVRDRSYMRPRTTTRSHSGRGAQAAAPDRTEP
jgi:hypothetical protein